MNKEWLKKKGIDKWFRRDNLIILVLSGILLFIIALPVEDGNTAGKSAEGKSGGLFSQTKAIQENGLTGKQNTGNDKAGSGLGGSGESYDTAMAEDELEYVGYLEERLEKMLGGVNGVGRVAVMITLESSEELVLEKDEPIVQSNVEEQDSQGGSRKTSQQERKETTVYSTDGSVSEPYVVKRLLPKVEGVLVVAQGAGSGTVNKNITEIVQALFDVEVHKIKVVPMETE